MTLDESFQVAVQRLNQQGQLLNGQLLKLLGGDKDAFREIRARLISEGFAEDRFGVGLGRLENADGAGVPHVADLTANESFEESQRSAENELNADWYLMASGIIQGPMTFSSLGDMRMCGEIQPADVVRNGTFGLWQRPDDVPELAAIKPNQRKRSPKIPVQEQVLEELPTHSRSISGTSSPGSKLTTEESGFYFWESGRSIGPVSRMELLERLKAGRLSRDEFVRFGIDGEWQPVSAIVAETNLVHTLPPSKLFEPLNEHQRQRNDQPPSSLSDIDIEQPEVRPRIEVSTPPVSTSTKRLVTTRPASNANTPPAEPATAQGRLSKSTIHDVRRQASKLVGGEKRLKVILMAVAIVFGTGYWMRQPPSANSIYQEFNRYHGQLTELKSRGVNDQAQWKRDIDRALSRTRSLVTGLKDPKTGASAQMPAKQELLWAGQDSLLKLLENPNLDAQTAKGFEEQFEYHMSQARRLLDGGTRSLPQEFASPSKRPDASGPPRPGAKAPQGPPAKPATPPRP